MQGNWGTRFGNTWATLRRGVIAMTILGAVTSAIFLGMAADHHNLDRWPVAILPLLGIPGSFILFTSPTLMFSIWIGGGRVRHVLLDRYVLADLPAADFEKLGLRSGIVVVGPRVPPFRLLYRRFGFATQVLDRSAGAGAAVLYFKHGQRIRFAGAHLGVMAELRDALKRAQRS